MPWCSQSSATHGTHSRPSARRRRAPTRPSSSRSYAFLGRLSTLIHRSQPNTEESTELQQRPRQMMPSNHDPRVVEVAAIRDRQVCLTVFFFRPSKPSDICRHCLLLSDRNELVRWRIESRTPHGGLVAFCSSAVYLFQIPMVLNRDTRHGQLFHILI